VWKRASCPYTLKLNGSFCCTGVLTIVAPWIPHGEHFRIFKGPHRCRSVTSGDPSSSTSVQRWFTSPPYRCAASGCRRRNQVPLQPQHSVWGHQSGQPSNSHERSDRVLTVFPAGYPHHGLQSTLADPGFTYVTTISQGTTSFTAPELLSAKFGLDKGSHLRKQTFNIYALSVTVYQVLTGK
jgi:hypothetical protein